MAASFKFVVAIEFNWGSVLATPKLVPAPPRLFGPTATLISPVASTKPEVKPMLDAVPLKEPLCIAFPLKVILLAVTPEPNSTFWTSCVGLNVLLTVSCAFIITENDNTRSDVRIFFILYFN